MQPEFAAYEAATRDCIAPPGRVSTYAAVVIVIGWLGSWHENWRSSWRWWWWVGGGGGGLVVVVSGWWEVVGRVRGCGGGWVGVVEEPG